MEEEGEEKMKLGKKKNLAARTFNVGKKRIVFVKARSEEIKEAITKQDIKDLHKDGAIIVKDIQGRKKRKKKQKRRTPGNVRKRVKTRKKDYATLARKLRLHIAELKKQGKLSREEVTEIRKKIRNKMFRSLAHLKEYIGGLEK